MRISLFILGLCVFAIGTFLIVTFPDMRDAGGFIGLPHALIGAYVLACYALALLGPILCVIALQPSSAPLAPLAALRANVMRRYRMRRACAYAALIIGTLTIGAIAAIAGQLAGDPLDKHGYRAAIHSGNYCYAAFGKLCR